MDAHAAAPMSDAKIAHAAKAIAPKPRVGVIDSVRRRVTPDWVDADVNPKACSF